MSHPQFRQYFSVREWQQIRDPAWIEERARARMIEQGMDPHMPPMRRLAG